MQIIIVVNVVLEKEKKKKMKVIVLLKIKLYFYNFDTPFYEIRFDLFRSNLILLASKKCSFKLRRNNKETKIIVSSFYSIILEITE